MVSSSPSGTGGGADGAECLGQYSSLAGRSVFMFMPDFFMQSKLHLFGNFSTTISGSRAWSLEPSLLQKPMSSVLNYF